MEHARISSSEGKHTAAQTGRTRAAAQQDADAAGAAQAGGSGGFLALLAALGDAVQATDALAPDAAAPDLAGLAPDGAVDAAALAAWQGLLQPTVVVPGNPQATAAGGQGLGNAAIGGAGAAGGGLPAAFALAPGGAMPGADGAPQGLVAETAMLDGVAGQKDGAAPGAVAGYGRILSRMQNALAQRAGGTATADAVTARAAAGDGTPGAAAGAAAVAALAGSAGAGLATVQAGATAGTAGVPERHAGAGSGPLSIDGLPVPSADAWASAGASGGAGREGGAAGQRFGESASTPGAWQDAAGSLAAPDAAGADGLAAFADQMPPMGEEQVAEQVAYWVHQKTQNAELTLNRDGQPVEVSVSLTGNEAHVTFRSDQAHTREVLDRSMAQLSELLRGEGLVLSGMSVGTPGGGAGGGDASQQQRQRGDARQAQVRAAAPVGAAGAARPGSQPDRAVDIFV